MQPHCPVERRLTPEITYHADRYRLSISWKAIRIPVWLKPINRMLDEVAVPNCSLQEVEGKSREEKPKIRISLTYMADASLRAVPNPFPLDKTKQPISFLY